MESTSIPEDAYVGGPAPPISSDSLVPEFGPGTVSDWELPPPSHLWGRGEYLLWWTQGDEVPALVTTSPSGTPQNVAGVLGEPGTTILFGASELNDSERSGGRVTIGYWLTPDEHAGIEAIYMGLGSESTNRSFMSQGTPILARPFFNLQTLAEDASLIAFPGSLEGDTTIQSSTDFQSAEVFTRRWVCCECNLRLDFLAGYRFAELEDDLRITDSLLSTGASSGIAVGTTIDAFDLFETRNEFHGGQFGFMADSRYGPWSLELLMKLALGNTHSEVRIDGSTTTTTPAAGSFTSDGGLLALPSNIGTQEEDDFAVIPEVGVTLGCDITCRLRATFGYTLIYWSRVARPGDQIDRDLNLSQLPPGPVVGQPRPELSMVLTDFWAQGMNFGLEYRF